MIEEIRQIGEKVFGAGLSDSHGASLSVRRGDSIFITKKEAMLPCLGDADLIETGMTADGAKDSEAPKGLAFHRAIYKKTNAQAIISACPPSTVAISISDSKVVPLDLRGSSILRSIPIMRMSDQITEDEAVKVAQSLPSQEAGVIVVKGRGSFAYAPTLEEALRLTTVLENSCRILIALRSTSGARPQPSPHPQRERSGEPRRAIPPGIGVMDRSRYRRKF